MKTMIRPPVHYVHVMVSLWAERSPDRLQCLVAVLPLAKNEEEQGESAIMKFPLDWLLSLLEQQREPILLQVSRLTPQRPPACLNRW